jgi:RND family efflux transporter MFP subunit
MPQVQSVEWRVDPGPGDRRAAGSSLALRALLLGLVLVTSTGLATGCRKAKSSDIKIPTVTVSHPLEKDVTDYVDFTGRTDAVEAVDVYCFQVSGYLERLQLPYTEGSMVQKGQLLFQIESALYKAQLEKAKEQDAVNESALNLARVVLKNAQDANIKVPGTVAPQEIAQDEAAVQSAESQLRASKANTRVAQETLNYTRVYAPISGQISRYYYTTGNLVTSQTKLTTIMSVDPMYVYFDVDEPTLQRIIKVRNEERQANLLADKDFRDRSQLAQAFPLLARLVVKDPIWTVLMAVPGDKGPLKNSPGDKKAHSASSATGPEDDYWYNGDLNFMNNQINSGTGSISMRGLFKNPEPEIVDGVKGERLLRPGMFVRVRLPIGKQHPAILVDDKAIGSDQGKKFVWVVVKGKDKEGKEVDVAQKRMIEPGQLQGEGLREIKSGLTTADVVIIDGSLKAEEGKPVVPTAPKPRKADESKSAAPAEKATTKAK